MSEVNNKFLNRGRPRRNVDGVFLLDKPLGISSSLALTKVRGMYRANKAGHTGALDPLASGMLPICLGEASKFSTYFLQGKKRYIATGRLGAISSTCDREGEIIERHEVNDALDRLDDVIEQFKGSIVQIPPKYSAIKVGGRALYKYARQGQEVEIPSRNVTIYELKVFDIVDSDEEKSFSVEVYCSKGTYIRTLIDDIGRALGCGAYVTMLRRIGVEGLPDTMMGLDEIQKLTDGRSDPDDFTQMDSLLLPIDKVMEYLPSVILPKDRAEALCHGLRQNANDRRFIYSLDRSEYKGPFQLRCDGEFLGVVNIQNDMLQAERMMSHPFGWGL